MLFGVTAAEEHAGIARNGKWECGKLEQGFARAWNSRVSVMYIYCAYTKIEILVQS